MKLVLDTLDAPAAPEEHLVEWKTDGSDRDAPRSEGDLSSRPMMEPALARSAPVQVQRAGRCAAPSLTDARSTSRAALQPPVRDAPSSHRQTERRSAMCRPQRKPPSNDAHGSKDIVSRPSSRREVSNLRYSSTCRRSLGFSEGPRECPGAWQRQRK